MRHPRWFRGGPGVGVLGAGPAAAQEGPSDAAVLNFALDLEYLEAEFYLRAVTGRGLDDARIDGTGTLGGVTGGRRVRFETRLGRQYAQEIADGERAHVDFLRAALGGARVARPAIDLDAACTAAAQAAGVVRKGQRFDASADEDSFLLGAFVVEDVGVTAYAGASPLISSTTFLEAAAGILAVEAHHAGLIRTVLLAKGLDPPANRISDARDGLDGSADLDQGITARGRADIVPTDGNSIAFSRTPDQVLNTVHLDPAAVNSGGSFPDGVNGQVTTSADST